MSALVIAGITVPVARGGATKRAPERVGSSSRAYAGNLRATYRVEKRVWQITTPLLLDSDATAIETAIAFGAHVTCSGAILGGSVSCEVDVGDSGYVPLTGGVFRRSLTLTIREV